MRFMAAVSRRCKKTKRGKARPTLLKPSRYGPISRSHSAHTVLLLKSLALEEPHLHAGQLYNVVVIEPMGLRSDRYAVDLRIVVFLAAVDVHDEIAFGTAVDRGKVDLRADERGE